MDHVNAAIAWSASWFLQQHKFGVSVFCVCRISDLITSDRIHLLLIPQPLQTSSQRRISTVVNLLFPIDFTRMANYTELPAVFGCVKNYQDTALDTDNLINLDL
ncbi:hypothetical protein [Komarekiella delphini-convector]|uniref:hypothetical protein n=1 Tax=Komarekiella delphini-convector TaxID=3050158 RepID=UPI001781D62E